MFRVTRSRFVEVIAGALETMTVPETWTRGINGRNSCAGLGNGRD
jgi:hypothetical protein